MIIVLICCFDFFVMLVDTAIVLFVVGVDGCLLFFLGFGADVVERVALACVTGAGQCAGL